MLTLTQTYRNLLKARETVYREMVEMVESGNVDRVRFDGLAEELANLNRDLGRS